MCMETATRNIGNQINTFSGGLLKDQGNAVKKFGKKKDPIKRAQTFAPNLSYSESHLDFTNTGNLQPALHHPPSLSVFSSNQLCFPHSHDATIRTDLSELPALRLRMERRQPKYVANVHSGGLGPPDDPRFRRRVPETCEHLHLVAHERALEVTRPAVPANAVS